MHPGGVEHRADAGGDAAADERRALERNLGIDLDQVLGGDGGVLRHGAAAGKDAERRAAAVVHARRALERRGKRLALLEAQHRSPGDAEAALAAHIDEGKDDVVAFGKIADALAHVLHHARALVAEHQRQRQRDRAGYRREIGMAHAAGAQAHQHLAALGRVDADFFDLDRLIVLAAENRSCLA